MLLDNNFADEAVRFLERPTSLKSWLNRYPVDSKARPSIVEQFESAPRAVAMLRGFKPTRDDIEYLLRWAFITVSATPAAMHGRIARVECWWIVPW